MVLAAWAYGILLVLTGTPKLRVWEPCQIVCGTVYTANSQSGAIGLLECGKLQWIPSTIILAERPRCAEYKNVFCLVVRHFLCQLSPSEWPQAYHNAHVSWKYRRKLRKQDILKRKILPESWGTDRYRKNITGHDLLQSETKIEAWSEIQVFAHGDNGRKRDFQSVVARNVEFWFRKFQQNLRERRTLVLMSYYSIFYVA
jgi:hypothetical protein